jgi:hypothetical protein
MTVSVIIDGPQEARSACNTVTVNPSTFGTGRYVEADLARTLERELAETERLRFSADADRRRLRAEVERLNDHAFDKDGTPWKTVCGWWSKKYDAVERNMMESAARAASAEARAEKAEAELANIANAKPDTWGDMSDSFQAWAQNRARHALAAMKGTP